MKYMSTQMKQVPWENEMAFNMVHETNEKKIEALHVRNERELMQW
jgi:hypothetical protein